jgi:hypothetical protein
MQNANRVQYVPGGNRNQVVYRPVNNDVYSNESDTDGSDKYIGRNRNTGVVYDQRSSGNNYRGNDNYRNSGGYRSDRNIYQSNNNNYRNDRNLNGNVRKSFQTPKYNNPSKDTYCNDDTKNHAIDFIFKNIQLSKYNYQLLEFTQDLTLLSDMTYLSPAYSGGNYLLIFFRHMDKYYSLMIDRTTLSYSQNLINYNRLIVNDVSIELSLDIYKGTIVDGILVGPNDFIVNDVYMFQGINCAEDRLYNKLLNFKSYLANNLKTGQNNLNLIVNNVYNMKDINLMLNQDLPKLTYNKYIKGISFFPSKSATKLIFLYNNCAKDTAATVHALDNEFKNNLLGLKPIDKKIICDEDNKTNQIFLMKKMKQPDVYKLYKDKEYIGLAYIPNLKISKYWIDLLIQTGKDEAHAECTYNVERSKWIPIKFI